MGTTVITAAIEHEAPLLRDERRFPVKSIRTNDDPHERDNAIVMESSLSVKFTSAKSG